MGGAAQASAQTSVYQKAQNAQMKIQNDLWESIGANLEPLIPAFIYLANIFLKLAKVITEPLKLISSLSEYLNGNKEAAIDAAESFSYLSLLIPLVGEKVGEATSKWAKAERALIDQKKNWSRDKKFVSRS